MVSFSTSVVNKFSIKDVWHYLLSNIDIKVKCEVENKKIIYSGGFSSKKKKCQ